MVCKINKNYTGYKVTAALAVFPLPGLLFLFLYFISLHAMKYTFRHP
ncbi:hypothetical protein HMPREF1548_05295 [Clostridium sp. KLE 1755]|nr:hypothetical protein HMPREF1548_05295 [Clostridium sp. KLE 1755]